MDNYKCTRTRCTSSAGQQSKHTIDQLQYMYNDYVHCSTSSNIILILSSAYNSCPPSPGGTMSSAHGSRLPTFDIMARYASKLLTQHKEGRLTPDSDKVCKYTSVR